MEGLFGDGRKAAVCGSPASRRADGGTLQRVQKPLWGDGAWCASELVWMTLALNAKFFPRARTTLADEACDLVGDLLCDVYFV